MAGEGVVMETYWQVSLQTDHYFVHDSVCNLQ